MVSFKKPEDLVDTFVSGWNENNADKLASIFVNEAEFVNVTGLWWHDKERIYKAHEYGLRVIFKDAPLKLLYTRKKELSEDVAIVHAKMKIENQTTVEGISKTAQRHNILLFVCKRYNESWMCEAVQNTEIVPGKETFVVDDKGNRSTVNYGQYEG